MANDTPKKAAPKREVAHVRAGVVGAQAGSTGICFLLIINTLRGWGVSLWPESEDAEVLAVVTALGAGVMHWMAKRLPGRGFGSAEEL